MTITTGTVLARLNYEIKKLSLPIDALAIVADIKCPTLVDKLAGKSEFTIPELAGVCRALSYSMSMLFAEKLPVEEQPCTVPECRQEMHKWELGYCAESHELSPIRSPHGWFSVHADLGPEADDWEVWVNADKLPDGRQAGVAVQHLADAIQKMQSHVDRLNGQRLERHTVAGQPDQHGIGGGL